jgi:hypothetical protein
MNLTPETTGWLVAAVVALLWIIGIVRRRIARYLFRRSLRRRQQRARRGELDAPALLTEEGYRVIDSQVHLLWSVYIDDEPIEIRLIADHLVERDGLRYVAEVKTGDAAPSIRTAATRRQLLEYLVAFDCDGALLVDMEEAIIQEIHFEGR